MREGLRPAVIGSGADSVAAKLHYPPKERDSKTEAVVVFFCEVAANGKAKNIRTYWNQGYNRFGDAVEKALNQGRFIPAIVGGKPTPILIGGRSSSWPTEIVQLSLYQWRWQTSKKQPRCRITSNHK
jgi:Gram-negative bacterial TonB protein C-terminal